MKDLIKKWSKVSKSAITSIHEYSNEKTLLQDPPKYLLPNILTGIICTAKTPITVLRTLGLPEIYYFQCNKNYGIKQHVITTYNSKYPDTAWNYAYSDIDVIQVNLYNVYKELGFEFLTNISKLYWYNKKIEEYRISNIITAVSKYLFSNNISIPVIDGYSVRLDALE